MERNNRLYWLDEEDVTIEMILSCTMRMRRCRRIAVFTLRYILRVQVMTRSVDSVHPGVSVPIRWVMELPMIRC